MMRLNFSVFRRPFSSRPALLAAACGVASVVMTSLPLMAQTRGTAPAQSQSTQAATDPNAAPFPPLSAAEQQRLDQILSAWEQQSQGTKTLECEFKRWHFDLFAAPAGIYANKAEGVIKYANPDKGLFQVKAVVSYDGKDENGKPKYSAKPGLYGEHWVCTGTELKEFDHATKQCKIQQLPPHMQGQNIIESPLPFVFNANAQQIKERYWVQPMQSPKPELILIAAYPKHQADRAQYKVVQIALDAKTFLPQALIMYAPNFDQKNQPKWDHYEFTNVKRNSINASLRKLFLQNFIDQEPPSDWKVFRDNYTGPAQIADGENQARRK
ncbi:TIGR03009 domain-containing protein [Rhodopirellula sp. JC740]|uniref:TIGR03009 domain-containing protein n=2 Tax=Rhodopirellula halodulae TaxID=2894198 RepID=A0ABS8NDW2_9BACT|nr:TIGR03009 domain-containing protein [Rhodopirellula sp. JC740]MCC9641747.1 TIGR03009 domain-containing protein [Rhodopirellula sp. JC740]